MSNHSNAKCKICRRAADKLFLRGERCGGPKCAIIKRNYPPGAHGPSGNNRSTPYGLQFKEKQKAKNVYGLRERQMKNYYLKAKKIKGNTAAAFLKYLEMRLDNIVYRLGLAKSRNQARQFVAHNHFLVNGKLNNRPSAQIKVNSKIAVKPTSRSSKVFQEMEGALAKLQTPLWLKLDPKEYQGQVISEPTAEEMKQNFDLRAIIEFYSR